MAWSRTVVAEIVTLWIWLLAVMPGQLVDAIDVKPDPGTTCSVKGRDAHLVWVYEDTTNALDVIQVFDGTSAGSLMGVYDATADNFTAFAPYAVTFSVTRSASLYNAVLTLSGLQDTGARTYTARFVTAAVTDDVATLEVAETSALGRWEICVDGACVAIPDTLTLSDSDKVMVKFIKNGTLSCDMDINVTPSVGNSCDMEIGAQDSFTAECDLGYANSLVGAGSLSIHLSFGKNGQVFHNDTDTIANITVISDATESTTAATTTNTNTTSTSPDTPGSPNTWNDLYVIPIVLGVCIIVIIIVVVVVVRRRKKMETGRPHPQDRSSGVSVGASAAGMPPGGQPRHKAQPNPQSGAPSGDMAYKVGYVDPDAPALFHDDRYDSGFGNTGYAH